MTAKWIFSRLGCLKHTLFVISIVALATSDVHAHGGHPYEHAYEEYIYGLRATFNFPSAFLPILITGLFVGTRTSTSWHWFGVLLFVGFIQGVFIGMLGWLPPDIPAYTATILIGIIIAISANMNEWLARAIIICTVAITANVMFSGYDWRVIPLFSYLGVGTAILLGSVLTGLVVRLVNVYARYAWVEIAWRVIASWIVAISILTIALLVSGKT